MPWSPSYPGLRSRSPRVARGALKPVKPVGRPLRFQYNPTTVIPGGGVGGWVGAERAKRHPASLYQGEPLETLTFSLIFDGWASDRIDRRGRPASVEQDCRYLDSLGRPRRTGGKPPRLRMDYGPVGKGHLWVINDLSWLDEQRGSDLHRVYAEVQVTLGRYEGADVTFTAADKHKRKKKGGGKATRHQVAEGDDLAVIAAVHYGDAALWVTIAEHNGIRDPRALAPGTYLSLPEL